MPAPAAAKRVQNRRNRAAGPWKSTVPAASFRGSVAPLSDSSAVRQNYGMNLSEAGVRPDDDDEDAGGDGGDYDVDADRAII
jgi:hypothetical protein